MNCLTEALGLSLPGNGTVLATHADRRELFLEAGRRIVEVDGRATPDLGSGALDDSFELADAGEQDGLAWAEARPRQTESGFESLRIGLADGQLRRMEMRDHFGQTTVIRFTRLRANPALAEDRFRFEPPAGADVIGELPGAR